MPFSFKAGCPSDLDCQPPPPLCPPLAGDAPPIDYLAKDFLSFRQALLDFSALRYPHWQERSEADFGVMFLEALSALADDLSYTQDRVAAEATLITATQRRSVVRHARLVDYEPQPALAATVTCCSSTSRRRRRRSRTARGGRTASRRHADRLRDRHLAGRRLLIRTPALSPQPPRHVRACGTAGRSSPTGSTTASRACRRARRGCTSWAHGFGFQPGQALLIETDAADPADPPIRQIVHL